MASVDTNSERGLYINDTTENLIRKTVIEDFTGVTLPSGWSTWTVGSGNSYSVNGYLQENTGSSGRCDIGAYKDTNVDFGVSGAIYTKITDISLDSGFANLELIFEDNTYPDVHSLNVGVNSEYVTSGANTGSGWDTVDFIVNTGYSYFRIRVQNKTAYFEASTDAENWVEIANTSFDVDVADCRLHVWTWDEDNAGTSRFDDITYQWIGISDERKLYLQGSSVSNSERDLYIQGIATTSSERDLYISGGGVLNSERGLYTRGVEDTYSERGLWIDGTLVSSSNRGFYIEGIVNGSALYKNFTIGLDNSALRNRVYVRGGTYLSDEVTIKQVADGEQTVFYLPEKPHDISILEGVTSKTVGIKNIDTYTDYDYLLNYQEKYIEKDNAPTVDTVLSISYKYDVPVLVAVEDSTSIEKYGQLEYIIFDNKITSIEQARDRASAELTDYAESITSGHFETHTAGFKAGQFLKVDLPDLDIDERFMVKSVRAKSFGGGSFTYDIQIVSTEMLGIIGFLIRILEDNKNTLSISSDEVVDEITSITAESFSLVADTPVLTTHEGAFKYDSDADWDIAEWDEV